MPCLAVQCKKLVLQSSLDCPCFQVRKVISLYWMFHWTLANISGYYFLFFHDCESANLCFFLQRKTRTWKRRKWSWATRKISCSRSSRPSWRPRRPASRSELTPVSSSSGSASSPGTSTKHRAVRHQYKTPRSPSSALVPVLDTAESVSSPGTSTRHRGVSSSTLVPVLDTAEFRQHPWYLYKTPRSFVNRPGTSTRHRGVLSAALVQVLDSAEFRQHPWYQY